MPSSGFGKDASKAITSALDKRKPFHEAWSSGQSTWRPLTPKWLRYKIRHNLMSEIWTASGRTINNLDSSGGKSNQSRKVNISATDSSARVTYAWNDEAIAHGMMRNERMRPFDAAPNFSFACQLALEDACRDIQKRLLGSLGGKAGIRR